MGGAGFRRWLQRVAQLTRRQREQLLDVLKPAVDFDRACATIEGARANLSCPHCGGRRLHRHGYDRGLQRYRCCVCKKTFNALSGTPLARLRHRDRWLGYLDGMLDGRSVRASAEALGVHRNTTFRWRHRFLHLTKHDRPAALTGIAEADEMFLLESQEGSRKQWLSRFRGVASRYLPNYLGWRWALDGDRITSAEQLLRIAIRAIHSG